MNIKSTLLPRSTLASGTSVIDSRLPQLVLRVDVRFAERKILGWTVT